MVYLIILIYKNKKNNRIVNNHLPLVTYSLHLYTVEFLLFISILDYKHNS